MTVLLRLILLQNISIKSIAILARQQETSKNGHAVIDNYCQLCYNIWYQK